VNAETKRLIGQWERKAIDAREAIAHFEYALGEWAKAETVSDDAFMTEVGILDAAGCLSGLDSPDLDALRYAVTGKE